MPGYRVLAMTPARPIPRCLLPLLLVSSSIALGGCAAHAAYVYDDPVYVSAAPVGIYAAPYVYYHGHPAYYVEGRWYYRSPRGWATFRREPRELYTYRSSRGAYRPWVYQAPRHDHRVYRAPARVYEAPRAHRDHRDREHHEHRGRRHDRDDRDGRADRGRRDYDSRPSHGSHRESRKHVHVDRDRRSNHR